MAQALQKSHKKAVESEIDVRKFDKPILLQTLKPENKKGTQNSNPEEKLQNLKRNWHGWTVDEKPRGNSI